MQKESTIYDIAHQLNISIATVSRALKDDPVVSKKTKKRIFDMAEQLGYRSNHFARNLRSQRTHTIGVIIPRINSHFMSTVIAGIEQTAGADGYNLIISQSAESVEKEKANAKTMYDNRVDGLLVSLAIDTADLQHFDAFFKKGIPVVFFDRVMEQSNSTNVLIDNVRAAYKTTSHLIEQGCTNIVHITATPKRNVYVDRLKGYKQALEDHGLSFSESNVIINNLSQDEGAAAAADILSRAARPDGVFAANDNCAAGCIIALKQAGIRVPQDIAVAGFNDDPVCRVIEPNLTAINYPGYQMGEVAARHLINYLSGDASVAVTNSILLKSELVVRNSSLRRAMPQG
ncbi:LacI family transcriptional regulator [Deminuibacter soli]|uniref:LacI family transcriptional regulator n=2 Tax=Deminuibacter soli TaxID=2291815 RepID=A0A3E1NIY2_9BACT|nr:LacI family transcriptional regulator [Deminuibacter soli]